MRQNCIDLPHMYSGSVTAYLMTAPSNRQTISDDLILLTSMQVPFPRRRDYHSLLSGFGVRNADTVSSTE